MDDDTNQICFFIAPIGEPGTPTREHSDLVLRHIVRAAVERFGYEALRADEIDRPGIITSQVIEHVVGSPLVIADLTYHNPNVFYELAIRHALRKPFVQMIKKGEAIPFDVATARTVYFDLDLNGAADAAEEVARQIESLREDPSDLETPISISLDLETLRGPLRTQDVGLHEVLPLLEDINSAVHNNSNEILRLRESALAPAESRDRSWDMQIHRMARDNDIPYGFIASVGSMRVSFPWIYELGTAAYMRALAGDIDTARAVFDQMVALIRSRYRPDSGFVANVVPELTTMFDRLIDTEVSNSSIDVNDLPF